MLTGAFAASALLTAGISELDGVHVGTGDAEPVGPIRQALDLIAEELTDA